MPDAFSLAVQSWLVNVRPRAVGGCLAIWYNPSHTQCMKTAISIRDEIFEAGERTANALGISRSELYAKAVAEFVSRHSTERITEQLDAVYRDDDSASALDPALESLQFRSLSAEDGW